MKKSNIYFLLFVFGLLLNACTYDFIAEEELPPVDPNVDVLFATQIVPIFADKCISCHKAGGQAPDLTSANAYNSLKNMSLINTTTPASSVILVHPNYQATTHTWKQYSAAESQLLLTWIQQGAKNN